MLGCVSEMNLNNKLLIYKQIIKLIWRYGSELWGTAPTSSVAIIERSQAKILRMITGAPWYVKNADILQDLKIKPVTEKVAEAIKAHKERRRCHQNDPMRKLTIGKYISRLKKFQRNK